MWRRVVCGCHRFLSFTLRIIQKLSNAILFKDPLTAQKMKFSSKDFFSKCDQIRGKLRIWSHLLRKSLMENFIFCVLSNLMFTRRKKGFFAKHIDETYNKDCLSKKSIEKKLIEP